MHNSMCVLLLPLMLFGTSTAQELRLDTRGNDATLAVGLVYVRLNDSVQWGYICDDLWSIGAAQVVCGQLGYGVENAVPGVPADFLPQVAQPPNIALTDVQCQGNEGNLWNCTTSVAGDCTGNGLAGVTCVAGIEAAPELPDIDINCNENNMIAVYPVPWTILPIDTQNLLVSNGMNYLTTPYSSPQLNVTQDEDEITYSRRVIITAPAYLTGAALFQRYDVDLTCDIPRQMNAQQTFRAQGTITVNGETNIGLQMVLYQDAVFQNQVENYPYEIQMGDWLSMAVVMSVDDERLRVVVDRCFAAPAPNFPDNVGQNYVFYDNRCLINPAISTTYPLDNDRFGFQIRSFVFDGFTETVLSCEAIICLQSDETEACDRTCIPGNRRRRRDTLETSSSDYTVYTVYSPLIYVGNRTSTGGQVLSVGSPASFIPALQESKTTFHKQTHRLRMTLGNAAVTPSLSLTVLLAPVVVALMSVCVLYVE